MSDTWIGRILATGQTGLRDGAGNLMLQYLSCDGATIARPDYPVLYDKVETDDASIISQYTNQRVLGQATRGGYMDTALDYTNSAGVDWATRYGETYAVDSQNFQFTDGLLGDLDFRAGLTYEQGKKWVYNTQVNASSSNTARVLAFVIRLSNVEVLRVYLQHLSATLTDNVYVKDSEGTTLLDTAGGSYFRAVVITAIDRHNLQVEIVGQAPSLVSVPVDLSASNVTIEAEFLLVAGGFPYYVGTVSEVSPAKESARIATLPTIGPIQTYATNVTPVAYKIIADRP